MSKKAIILFSGGLDSTTCLAIAKSQNFIPYALSFKYGQKHDHEIDAATEVVKKLGAAEHRIFNLPIGDLGGSSLTDSKLEVQDYQESDNVPLTYVPARNTIFLSIALAWAEIIDARDIFIGINHQDYSGYPDCRPIYLEAFTKMANLATKVGIEGGRFTIHAPIIQMNKAQIIKEGVRLGIDYGLTTSCYRLDAQRKACGKCDSCFYRKKGFLEAGVEDPTVYQ